MYIWPPVIDGVEFLYLTTIDRQGHKGTVKQVLGNLDSRNLVFLTRLATLMKWNGATTIWPG